MKKERAALLIVDVQNDFCPGGALAVNGGDAIVPVLNEYVERFSARGLPIFATRDWHPEHTSHFKELGGAWPPHCVAGTAGAEFHRDLKLPDSTLVFSKGTRPDEDAYSAFHACNDKGASLSASLLERGARDLYIGGLATDYCVRETVLDALKAGFRVVVLEDAVRGVDVQPGDSQRALEEMTREGARTIFLGTIDEEMSANQ